MRASGNSTYEDKANQSNALKHADDNIHHCTHGFFPYFGLFLLSGINDGGTANLSDLASLSIEGPAADFVSQHVFNEKHSTVKAQPQLIKQFDVLQQVVIRVTGGEMRV